ncbi:MAG: tetratricopeptide repeat protein [Fidelibacterota bacterium]
MQKIIISLILITIIGAQTPDALMQDGQSMLDNNDLEGAKMVLEQALQADPTFAPVMILLSHVYLRMGDMDSTKKYINNAIDTDPENQEYRDEFERLNEINTLMADGKRNLQNGDLAAAYESYRIVLEKFPFFSEADYSMGLVKFREKDFPGAVSHFKNALLLNPQHENARTAISNVAKNKFNEGNNSYRRRDLEGALTLYKEVLDIDESFYQAHYQIGVIQSKMGNRAVAIEHYEKALEIAPNFYKGYYALALSQKARGDVEAALKSFQAAIDINPGYDKAYGAMGDIYFEQQKYDEAISVLNTSIQVNPKYAKGYLNLGIIYSEQEQFESAISNLEMATSLNEKSYMSWYRLAAVYNAINDCENAKRAARKCTDMKNSFGGGWLELGIAEWCGGKGNKRATENALEKARNDRSWRKSAEYELDKVRNPEKYQK